MIVHVDKCGTPTTLKETLDLALETGGVESLLVLACDGNDFTPERLDPILKEVPVPIFGGTFPVVLNDGVQMTRGSLVVALNRRAEVYHISGMSDSESDFEAMLDEQVGDDDRIKTVMVFMDGLSRRIDAFIDALYSIFGLEVNYVGGGAGSLSLKQKPCLITNDGLIEDSAVLAALDMESGVGVSHGWSTVSGPYKVTESDSNAIKSLDWRPAFDVYRSVVEAHSGTVFATVPFFDISIAYPFGIAKMGSERVVRDPVAIDGDHNLICVGEVPEGEYVDILHSKKDDLIRAAGRALDRARDNFPKSAQPGFALFIDCVSRLLFLKDDFQIELNAATPTDFKSVGVCSIGEIANSGKDYLEFFNKTSVVAFLEDE